MRYKVHSKLFAIGCILSCCLSILFGGYFIITFYGLIAKHNEIIKETSFNLINSNLGVSIGFCVGVCLLSICFGFFGRICHIGVFWSKYQDVEYRDLLYDKKHPTALDKIKALYPNDVEKWKSYARGEFKENNGIYIYTEKLEKYNVQNRIEKNVKFSDMVHDFTITNPFAVPKYRKDTFPQHRSYEDYLSDLEKEKEELAMLKN